MPGLIYLYNLQLKLQNDFNRHKKDETLLNVTGETFGF